ncbi:AMP-binding protein [Bradyrhizobium yuanmingense]|uniref:class I adenylate-forming enzyme family protein n=1 Tax=Bradyrhizobium yuanmingense TaxID=108015 RepID=UPI0012F78B42|nr:class I adenylate-forming enzyme family protein [Bradyrhizobium yuanmingense]MVT54221.1 AMP-binding protein [Bradyrhizobium yuanmingense]
MRLDTIFRAQAVRYPEKTALVCGSDRVSYGELDRRILYLAAGLLKLGAKAGDRLVVYLPNGIELVELLYAAFSIGVIVVPVPTRLTPLELQYICRDSKPFAVLWRRTSLCAPKSRRTFRTQSSSPPPKISGTVALAELRTNDPTALHRLPFADDALVMYTSGTTGAPKGAVITHSNLIVQNYFVHAVEWGISSDDIYLVTTPLAHRAGLARLANALRGQKNTSAPS